MREQTELEKAIISTGGNCCKICENERKKYVTPFECMAQEGLHESAFCKSCRRDYPNDKPMHRFRLAGRLWDDQNKSHNQE